MMQAYQKNQQDMTRAFAEVSLDPTNPDKNLDALKNLQLMQSKMVAGMLQSWQDFGSAPSSSPPANKNPTPHDASPNAQSARPGTSSSAPADIDLESMKEQVTALQKQLAALSKKI